MPVTIASTCANGFVFSFRVLDFDVRTVQPGVVSSTPLRETSGAFEVPYTTTTTATITPTTRAPGTGPRRRALETMKIEYRPDGAQGLLESSAEYIGSGACDFPSRSNRRSPIFPGRAPGYSAIIMGKTFQREQRRITDLLADRAKSDGT